MNTVLIIPTGIGAEIGGHAGDGNPVAKLLASVSDTLITHPNVLNASDINEMTENTLYVEGSILDSFLEGSIGLKRVKSNTVLIAANSPVHNDLINAVSAARSTIGLQVEILELATPLRMIAAMEDGIATGQIYGAEELIRQVKEYDFDALGISSAIEVSKDVAFEYLNNGQGVNPWGGVEAKLSRMVAEALNRPVAHAPFGHTLDGYSEIVDPRMASEMVSVCYIHCILKGLHRAPRPTVKEAPDITVHDIDCMVTPANCYGRPHRACMAAGIPVIAVKENRTVLCDWMPDEFIVVENYLEACGVISAMRAGVSRESVRRPLAPTIVKKAIPNP